MLTIEHFILIFDTSVVEFSSAADVENALKTLNGEDLRGNPVTLREVSAFGLYANVCVCCRF